MADRYIDPALWNNPDFSELTLAQKAIWLYLLTSPKTRRCGILRLIPRTASADIGVDARTLDAAIQHYCRKGWTKVDQNNYIWIVKFVEYQSKQPNWLAKCRADAEELISSTDLALEFLERYSQLPEVNSNAKRNRNENETELTVKSTAHTHTQSHTHTEDPLTPADASPAEIAALAEMRAWRGFTNYRPARALEQIRKLAEDYPGVNVCSVVSTVTLWLEDAKHLDEHGSLLRLRNFCRTESTRLAERGLLNRPEPVKPAASDERDDAWSRPGDAA